MAAILKRYLTYRGLEGLIDPLGPATVEQPPSALLEVYRFFLKPVKWLIVATLVVSLIASVIELAMFGFLGSLVDRMAASSPERFVAGQFLAARLHGLRAFDRAAVLQRSGRAPSSTSRSRRAFRRWCAGESYRYVLRQSLGFFQNDYAGRISQKVMQTGMALRESVVNVVDGVWYLPSTSPARSICSAASTGGCCCRSSAGRSPTAS